MLEEQVPPSIDLLDSLRAVGYSLEAAIADLVDNSISAGANLVRIDADVVDGEFIAILDDGTGMSPGEAREALRLAGSTRERTPDDLGRFGLGLKTASLSQGRSLTVASTRGSELTGLRWDIDHVREKESWSLLVLNETDLEGLPLWQAFRDQGCGTLVVWHKLDLLLGDANDPGSFLASALEEVRQHLSLVFHRFLTAGANGVAIRVNGVDLAPIDPFLSSNVKTQVSPVETIMIEGSTVTVTAFTLPHPSGLSASERKRRDLGDGMRDAQGFYVYRNRRLISHGHWYGLARMNELTKQTRIRVDVPSALDRLWQLDIKKSRAEAPASFKSHLRRLIEPVLSKGKRVHTFRGRSESPDEARHVWSKMRDRDGFRYDVNLRHPLVASALTQVDTDVAERLVALFELLGDSLPLLDAYQEMAGNTQPTAKKGDPESAREHLRSLRDAHLLEGTVEAIAVALERTEPFIGIAGLDRMVAEVWGEPNGTR